MLPWHPGPGEGTLFEGTPRPPLVATTIRGLAQHRHRWLQQFAGSPSIVIGGYNKLWARSAHPALFLVTATSLGLLSSSLINYVKAHI